ncbi:MAG: hypothetical protein GF330_03645, partial [Candidatus Eisenbacteria bacterium]|nr:hypothetical protein [Candidatus Eisenbacteria bacterium]
MRLPRCEHCRRPHPARARRAALPALLLLGVLLGVSPISRAQSPLVEASRYKGWRTAGLEIRGLPGDLTSELKKGMTLSGRFRIYRRVRPNFYPDLLAEDLRRVRLFLARRGYPYARITPRFLPERDRRRLRIALDVAAGQPVRVATLEIAGLPARRSAGTLPPLPLHPE